MSGPRIGELFAGYGGLGLGVQAALGGEIAWYSEIDKGALKILGHRFPDVPNIGDITTVNWSQVEPVDILTGGSPCQDLSHAGKRAGMTEGTRSNLWVAMREAIAQLRPGLVCWENVRGAASAAADSDLEPCPGCVGDRPGVSLRALGRVVGDLAELGYVGGFHGLRAADVGAPHGRFRYFLVARPEGYPWRLSNRDGGVAADTDGRRRIGGIARADLRSVPDGDAERATGSLLPTPATSDTNGPGAHGDGGLDLRTAVAMLPTPTVQDAANTGGASQFDRNSLPLNAAVTLLPTPAVNDMGEGKTVDHWDTWTADMQAKHGNGNGHGKSLSIEAQRLLPTPTSANAADGADLDGWESARLALIEKGYNGNGRGTPLAIAVRQDDRWGDYAPAIARWENILGRPAPAPTMTSTKGNPQLAPAFVEWLMGLPAGWVTDAPGITRNEALRALGNGVVPQQAEAAIRWLFERVIAA